MTLIAPRIPGVSAAAVLCGLRSGHRARLPDGLADPAYAADMDGTGDSSVAHGPQTPSRAELMSAHAEGSISEDAILTSARERAMDIGAGAVSPAVGALLSLLAKLSGGKAVAEVGTGAGVSGLWLLSGMSSDGVLTTIDIEPEHLRLAKQAFHEAGIGPSRTRLIGGRAQEVLTRLADEAYDLVFVDADPVDQPDYVVEGVRLLRPGGVIVVHRAALGGRAGDPAARDAEVTAVREAARLIAEDERLTPALVPLGDGVLAAVRD
ncbi:Putative O-methyltransferase [Mycobacterium persicum]|uniref:O-methyltransferase n=2 Tax=Mycobacterium persicum TaxID=1487726 RepID=A0AB38UWP6_9MYCO|nr:Putative O-methyltransferase [Mycobacterium persicum]